MLLKDYPVVLPDYILTLEELSPENCLFFDIETTGLSWKTSHLYLLGAVFYENEIWIHRQWFCQKPGEEKEVLLAFSELLSTRKLLFHYNGTTFDVPYLMHKYTFYQLPAPWEGTRQLDLYQLFSPLKRSCIWIICVRKIWNMQPDFSGKTCTVVGNLLKYIKNIC